MKLQTIQAGMTISGVVTFCTQFEMNILHVGSPAIFLGGMFGINVFCYFDMRYRRWLRDENVKLS